MGKKFKFETTLINGPFKGVYAEFPFDSRKEFGTNRHVWCQVSIDDYVVSMNLLPNGKGGHWLHLKKEIRDKIGKREGDNVTIELQQALKPRTVEIPDYLQWLLDNDGDMQKYFNRLPISGKKFWIQHIEESKNDDTKVERVNRFFEFLHKHYAHKS
ncbi:YdeI/OmpD-associated family protein [uncultured Draconibacterium sp.]|uniref:YdeI/OmpD-associated family protein n=1 Tax=uncultured Draconibacterium sp. TaxID=1573823 RepID=UPI0029C83949|nr:YdeI/OmpD-associated family protein [uncultured Draconibacterium sp.]